MKITGTHHLIASADDVNLLGENINTTKKSEKLDFALVRRLVHK
jgi:hypothetical protein